MYFSQLSQCQTLIVTSNMISEVEHGAFNGLYNLSRLILTYNKLERLYVDMFSVLTKCRALFLDGNHISVIEPGSFNGLGNLRVLGMGPNNLMSLSPVTFSGLTLLQEVYLYYNHLTSLSVDVFKHMPRQLRLTVADNPFNCDAELCWLKQEELNGTIIWIGLWIYVWEPRCKNKIDWKNWTCEGTSKTDEQGNLSFLYLIIKTFYSRWHFP